MNDLFPNVPRSYEIMEIMNNVDIDEYQSDIHLCIPERFYPKLTKEEIETIETPFCVDNMLNTKTFSSHKRPIRIIKKYREKFNLKKEYTLSDIIDVFKNKKVYTVRRDIDEYGNKVDDKYVIIEATVVNIIPMICDEYDYTNLMLDFGDKEELVSINRVFFKKHLNFDNVL